MSKLFRIVLLSALAAALLLAGPASAADALKLATTTSTANTGLLDYLAPMFQKDTGVELQWVAVGTGKALALGKNCDVDALMVHAPAAEKKYVADGFGVDRREIMYNDFVIIGPEADPAGIKGLSVAEALKKIAAAKAPFFSRGDNSGTHKKELSLWQAAGMTPPAKSEWYLESGQGMIATIRQAAERGGYTMADRGTYIKYEDNMKGKPDSVILVEGDDNLFNQYSVMTVNPDRCPKVRPDLAGKFADWITSQAVQDKIGDFKLLGKKLFIPNAK